MENTTQVFSPSSGIVEFSPSRARQVNPSLADFTRENNQPFYVRVNRVVEEESDTLVIVPAGNEEAETVSLVTFTGDFLPSPVKKLVAAGTTVTDVTIWW